MQRPTVIMSKSQQRVLIYGPQRSINSARFGLVFWQKKLCFGLSQTHFLVNFFIYARFGLQKVQTNAHLA